MDLDDLLDEVLNDPRNGGVNAGQPKQTSSFQPPAAQSQQIRYSDQNAGSASYQQPKQQVAAPQMQSNNFGGSGYGAAGRSSIQAAAANGNDDDDDWDAEDDQPAPS